jgi:hypothetical protein
MPQSAAGVIQLADAFGHSNLSQQLNVRLNSQAKSNLTQIFKEKGVDVSGFFNNFNRRFSSTMASLGLNSDWLRPSEGGFCSSSEIEE